MVEILDNANPPLDVIHNLLDAQQTFPPGHSIDWDSIFENSLSNTRCSRETFQFLVQCSLAYRVNVVGVKLWRDDVAKTEVKFVVRSTFLTEIRSKLAHYEAEYYNSKESTSTLELTIWKAKINESRST